MVKEIKEKEEQAKKSSVHNTSLLSGGGLMPAHTSMLIPSSTDKRDQRFSSNERGGSLQRMHAPTGASKMN